MTALGDVLAALAVQPGLTRLFPGLAAAPADAALAQWAACATLGGRGVRDLGSDAISGALPWAPEFCAWAVSVMGVPLADARLPLDGAATFLATLRSSARAKGLRAAVHAHAEARALTRHGAPACVVCASLHLFSLVRPCVCGADDALPPRHAGAGAERDGAARAPAARVRPGVQRVRGEGSMLVVCTRGS